MAFSTTAPAVEVSSSESSSSLLRLATFNVHQWEDARGVDNIERVAQLVKVCTSENVSFPHLFKIKCYFLSSGPLPRHSLPAGKF